MSEATPPASIVEVSKIWSEAPHNAFTDLLHFRKSWYCVFREGKDGMGKNASRRRPTGPRTTSHDPRNRGHAPADCHTFQKFSLKAVFSKSEMSLGGGRSGRVEKAR